MAQREEVVSDYHNQLTEIFSHTRTTEQQASSATPINSNEAHSTKVKPFRETIMFQTWTKEHRTENSL